MPVDLLRILAYRRLIFTMTPNDPKISDNWESPGVFMIYCRRDSFSTFLRKKPHYTSIWFLRSNSKWPFYSAPHYTALHIFKIVRYVRLVMPKINGYSLISLDDPDFTSILPQLLLSVICLFDNLGKTPVLRSENKIYIIFWWSI